MAAFFAGLLIAGAAAAPVHAEIRIAVASAFSGQFAPLGDQMLAGARLAVEDINASGGLRGEKLVLEEADDRCDPERAVAQANQLTGKGVQLVIGHLCSSATLAAAPVYAEAGRVQITVASALPQLTEARPGPGFFRLGPREDATAPFIAERLAQEFADKRIGLVTDRSAYGKDFATRVKAAMQAKGLSLALEQEFDAGTRDLKPLASTLKGERLDVVVLGAYAAEAGHLSAAFSALEMQVPVFAGDAAMGMELGAAAGDAASRVEVAFMTDPAAISESPAGKAAQRLREAGAVPSPYAIDAYAAVQLFAAAADASGSFDFAPVAAALQSGNFETVSGTVAFTPEGTGRDLACPGTACRTAGSSLRIWCVNALLRMMSPAMPKRRVLR
ncbi:branched-chain amino acid ABC transporter substrate-binding protein [Pannonibacter phragmitetus]|uniref:branched-chain amino acid ABC transporter substrate-binding protein n=1 Tax=Pannonibacter phragmitetus TaxID=121719 RepID=UPI003D2EECDD